MRRPSRTIGTALAAAAAGVVYFTPAILQRAGGSAVTWNNASGDAAWGTASNWLSLAVPGGADSVLLPAPFPGPGGQSAITLPVGGAVAHDLTINGNYTLNAGSITLGAGATINTSAAPVINSSLSGTGGLTKLGTGTLTLAASNTYSGGMSLLQGTLNFYSSANFGSGDISFEGGSFRLINGGSITNNLALNAPGIVDTNAFTATCFGAMGGTGSLTKAGAGTLTLSGPINYTGATSLTGGTLRLSATTQTLAFPSVSVGGNAKLVILGATGTILKTPVLSVGAGGSIDIGLSKMIVPSGDVGSFSGSAYTGITGLVQAGRNGNALPLWDGSGIVSSHFQATGGNFYSIGIARASDVRPETATTTALWANQTVTAGDILVMCTYGGDANLDGRINIDDYVRIDKGIAGGLTGWSNGDFNYDGKVNIDDYTMVIDANLGIQTGVFFTSTSATDSTSATSPPALPEVSSFVGVAAMGMLRMARGRRGSGSV